MGILGVLRRVLPPLFSVCGACSCRGMMGEKSFTIVSFVFPRHPCGICYLHRVNQGTHYFFLCHYSWADRGRLGRIWPEDEEEIEDIWIDGHWHSQRLSVYPLCRVL